jgi:hypothetical protein
MPRTPKVQTINAPKSAVQAVVDQAVKGDATIYIGSARVKPREEFVMMFGANVDMVLKNNDTLTMQDIRVLFCVLAKMSYGNQLAIKQNAIASELGIDTGNVSKAWGKLKKAGVFFKDRHGNEYVNFDLFLKGQGTMVLDNFQEQADLAHQILAMNGNEVRQPFGNIPKVRKPRVAKAKPVKAQPTTPTTEDIPF